MATVMRTWDQADKQRHPSMRGGAASREAYTDHAPHVADHVIGPQGVGNQAVQRLFHSGAIQAKLTISQPNDPYEQEADRIADQVMRRPDSTLQGACVACAPGAPCPACEGKQIQRKAACSPEPSAGVSSHIASLRAGGQPLPASTRAFFEPRFGQDFSGVRVHTGAQAAKSAKAIQAKAFTTGQDIAFGAGQFAPGTSTGSQLLAHELTHVVQQRATSETEQDRRSEPLDRPVTTLGAERVQLDWLDDAKAAVSDTYDSVTSAVDSATTSHGKTGAPAVASLLPGGTGDWHEFAQAIVILIAGLDLALIARDLAPVAIKEAGNYTRAGGDYGPQNALRHCIFAGLLYSHGWKTALKEIAASLAPMTPLNALLLLYGATMSQRVRIVLMAHEWFADDSCGNFGTGTVDSECDQHNNEVGIGLGGPFTTDATIISGAKAALDAGRLLMTPGPKDLSRTVSTSGWRSGPWMAGGPQDPDCSSVNKK